MQSSSAASVTYGYHFSLIVRSSALVVPEIRLIFSLSDFVLGIHSL